MLARNTAAAHSTVLARNTAAAHSTVLARNTAAAHSTVLAIVPIKRNDGANLTRLARPTPSG